MRPVAYRASWPDTGAGSRPPRVLMVDVNNSVPTDRRIWLECRALVEDGFEVVVICPARKAPTGTEHVDGVAIHRYAAWPRSGRPIDYVLGYAVEWWRTAVLVARVWREERVDVVQLCNPPDTYFPIAAALRLRGARFVFDQHDLCPEIYRDRFGGRRHVIPRILQALERATHRSADHVITVNESCRQLLLRRTATRPHRLTVVATGPDLDRLVPTEIEPALRNGRTFLCAYLGVMGPQDCVEVLLEAVAVLVHELGRTDIHFVLMGDGDRFTSLTALATQLQIDPWVTFTGFADDRTISAYLSASDLGLQPDRRTPFTDLCTMLKTVEYMAFGLPVVAFPLTESRRAAGEAARFVTEETPRAYAEAIRDLLDDPQARARMGEVALRRARHTLAWHNGKAAYLEVMRALARVDCPAEAARPGSS